MVRKVRTIPDSEQAAAIKALEILHSKRPRGTPKPLPTSDSASALTRIYLDDMPFMQISAVKNLFYSLRVRMSKIKNISFIGKRFIEILLDQNYREAFINLLNIYHIKVLPDFNPAAAYSPHASEQVRAMAASQCAKRISKIAESCPHPATKAYFSAWLASLTPSHEPRNSIPMHPITPSSFPKLQKSPQSTGQNINYPENQDQHENASEEENDLQEENDSQNIGHPDKSTAIGSAKEIIEISQDDHHEL